MNSDIWEHIAMCGPVLSKVMLLSKNFDVKQTAATKIQREYRSKTKKSFNYNDRVVCFSNCKIVFGKVVGKNLNKKMTTIEVIGHKKIYLFVNSLSETFSCKILGVWKY